MAKVRMLAQVTTLSGEHGRGEVYDTDDDEAARLVAMGLAEEVKAKPAPEPETAAVEAPENTMRRRPGPRKNAPRGEKRGT